MLRLLELALRTARLKDARGLPAILVALRPFLILAVLSLCPPDAWSALITLLPKVLSSAFR